MSSDTQHAAFILSSSKDLERPVSYDSTLSFLNDIKAVARRLGEDREAVKTRSAQLLSVDTQHAPL